MMMNIFMPRAKQKTNLTCGDASCHISAPAVLMTAQTISLKIEGRL